MALILVTRPQPDAEATAAKLRTLGHEAIVAPLLQLEAIDAGLAEQAGWAGILVSSANALRALPRQVIPPLAGLPLLAVGRRTAAVARESGFLEVQSADGDVHDLARLAVARFSASGKPILYLAGEERSGDLAGEVAEAGIAVETRVVYRMTAAAAFPPPVRALITAGRVAGVLHFSRRSAETFCACARGDQLEGPALAAVQYCLSQAVAAVFHATVATVRVASRPEEDALLGLIPR